MILSVILFIAYSAFCWWVVFWDGAEVLEGWKGWLVDSPSLMTTRELRIGTAISWLTAVVIGLIAYFSD